jgi:hypothetical protein
MCTGDWFCWWSISCTCCSLGMLAVFCYGWVWLMLMFMVIIMA